jgi:hypothetical protein
MPLGQRLRAVTVASFKFGDYANQIGGEMTTIDTGQGQLTAGSCAPSIARDV